MRGLLSYMIPSPKTWDAMGVRDVFRSNGFPAGQVHVWGDRPTKMILIDLLASLGSSKIYARFDAVIESLGAYYSPVHKKWIIRY